MIDVIAVCGIRNSAKCSVTTAYNVRNNDIISGDIAVNNVSDNAVNNQLLLSGYSRYSINWSTTATSSEMNDESYQFRQSVKKHKEKEVK